MGDAGLGRPAQWDDRRAYFLSLNEETLSDREKRWSGWRDAAENMRRSAQDPGCYTCNRFRRLHQNEFSKVGELETNAVGGFLTPDCVMNFPGLIGKLRERTIAEHPETQNEKEIFCSGATVDEISHDGASVEIAYTEGDSKTRSALRCQHCVMALGAWAPKLLRDLATKNPEMKIKLPPIILRHVSSLHMNVCLYQTLQCF